MKLKKNQFGQSLIEVLIALAIFAIIIVPFLSSVIDLASPQIRYRHRTQATQYCREGLEITYNLAVNCPNWQQFVATHLNHTFHPTSTGNLDLVEGIETLEGKFQRGLSFEKEDQTLKVVALTSWIDRGREEKVELTTYLIDFSQF